MTPKKSTLSPKERQRYITKKAKEMHLKGETTEAIAKALDTDEEYIIWVLRK